MFAFIYIEETSGKRNILSFITKLVCHQGVCVCIMRVCVCVSLCVMRVCVCVWWGCVCVFCFCLFICVCVCLFMCECVCLSMCVSLFVLYWLLCCSLHLCFWDFLWFHFGFRYDSFGGSFIWNHFRFRVWSFWVWLFPEFLGLCHFEFLV